MSSHEAFKRLPRADFETLVFRVIKETGRFATIARDIIFRTAQFDIIATEQVRGQLEPTEWLFEIRTLDRSLSRELLEQTAKIFQILRKDNPRNRFILVANVPLTTRARFAALENDIEVWEPEKILQIAGDDTLREFFGTARSSAPGSIEDRGNALIEALRSVPAGKTGWSKYQERAADLLKFLFCPPLEPPKIESPDSKARNRRDMVFENNASTGFWAEIKRDYGGHLTVVDAKNYTEKLGKRPVIDVANYLKLKGCGLFAVIVSRLGAGEAAEDAIHDQWISNSKMILSLNDDELAEAVKLKIKGDEPENLLRRKVASIRASV